MKKLILLLLIICPMYCLAQRSKPQHEPKTIKYKTAPLPQWQMVPVVSDSTVINPQDGFLINGFPNTPTYIYMTGTQPNWWIKTDFVTHIDTIHLNLSRMKVLNDSTFTVK